MAGTRDQAPRRALRSRRLQALALLLMSAAITGIAASAPLYTRGMSQALTTSELTHAPLVTTSLSISSQQTSSPDPGVSTRGVPGVDAETPEALAASLPADLRHHYFKPLLGYSAAATNGAYLLTGQVVWRQGQCAHVTWIQGTCPAKAGEIAVSEPDLKLGKIRLGGALVIPAVTLHNGAPATATLTVVGVYRPEPGPFWELRPPTGSSGLPYDGSTAHDDWLTAKETFGPGAPPLTSLLSEAIFRLDPSRTDVDDLVGLPGRIREAADGLVKDDATHVELKTSVGDVAGDVRHQRSQAAKTVPLLMVQVLLLGLLVAWQLLTGAANQRRGEAALAVLRGRGRRGAARLLSRELLPPIVVGIPLGAGLALLLGWFGRHQFLPYSPAFEAVPGFWIALAGATVVLVGLTTWAVSLVAREPVAQLLQSVNRPRGVGIWAAVLMAIAGTGAVAFVAGWLGPTGALAGPALLAVVVGLIVSYAVAPLTARLGRRSLRRGRVRTALALTDAARSPGAQRLVAMTIVATALLVFATDAVAVGARNRERAADQEVGAARVTTVSGDLTDVQAALASVDPHGEHATVVTISEPPNSLGAVSTVGVNPEQFRRIALLDQDQDALPWKDLTASTTPPLEFTGRTLQVKVEADFSESAPVDLLLSLAGGDGKLRTAALGRIRPHGTSTLTGDADCRGGCTVVAIGLDSLPGSEADGTISLSSLRVEGEPLPWGGGGRWRDLSGSTSQIEASDAGDGGLGLKFVSNGSNRVAVTSTWLPATLPTLLAGKLPVGQSAKSFEIIGLDGTDRPATRVHATNRVPGLPMPSAITDLAVLSHGDQPEPELVIQVWSDDPGAAFAKKLDAAYGEHHVTVEETASVAEARKGYDRSVAAWSLALAVVVGIASLLVALLALVIVTVTGWQVRTHDIASLRMAGIPVRRLRQATIAGQVGAVAIAVAIGTATGLVGADIALDDVPILAHAPVGWTLDVRTSWPVVVGAIAAAFVVLGAASWIAARLLATRARLDRLREM